MGISQRTRVNDILAMLGRYQAFLGPQEEGFFYKLAYENYVGNGAMPRVANFRLYAERTGWDWESPAIDRISDAIGESGYLASLPAKPGETEEEANKREDFASQIVFKEDVTLATAKKHLENLLQVFHELGYKVRMGAHELGLIINKDGSIRTLPAFRKGHLHMHLERAADPDAEIPVDVSLEFWVDAGPFTGPINKLSRASLGNLPDDEIALNYLDLFRSSLTKEGRQALIQIATPSTKK